MSKLDKQGLNTFIRELDKHVNTKINRLDISPSAEKIIMADGSTLEEAFLENKNSILANTQLINALQVEVNGQRLRAINIHNQLENLL